MSNVICVRNIACKRRIADVLGPCTLPNFSANFCSYIFFSLKLTYSCVLPLICVLLQSSRKDHYSGTNMKACSKIAILIFKVEGYSYTSLLCFQNDSTCGFADNICKIINHYSTFDSVGKYFPQARKGQNTARTKSKSNFYKMVLAFATHLPEQARTK